jgi:hypothetical protein
MCGILRPFCRHQATLGQCPCDLTNALQALHRYTARHYATPKLFETGPTEPPRPARREQHVEPDKSFADRPQAGETVCEAGRHAARHQNGQRTACYHFATEQPATGRNSTVRIDSAASDQPDFPALSGTSWDGAERQSPNQESDGRCVCRCACCPEPENLIAEACVLTRHCQRTVRCGAGAAR